MKASHFAIAVVGVLLFSAGWFLADELTHETELSASSGAQENPGVSAQQKAELTAEIARLKNMIAGAEDARPQIAEVTTSSRSSFHHSNSPAQNGEPTKHPTQPESSTNKTELRTDNAANEDNSVVDLPSIFSKESRDEEWAFARERKLHDSLATDHYFQGQELSAVECKSSSCRVQFYAADMQQKMEIASRLNRLFMTQQRITFDPQIMIGESNDEQFADFYFREVNTK